MSKPLMIILLIAVLGFGGYYTYRVLFEGYTLKPAKIFSEAFEEKPESITGLTGGGTISGNYDYWIHFKLPGRAAALKIQADFVPNDADKEMARRYFAGVETPSDPSMGVTEFNNLKFYNRVKNETQSVSSEWLLHNWRTDDQYYRKWGY